jgi:hypothetical protein
MWLAVSSSGALIADKAHFESYVVSTAARKKDCTRGRG